NDVRELHYNKKYLDHNFYLLLNTIRSISNKLYVNWIDVSPYDIITFKNTKLYRDTVLKYENGQLEYWNPINEHEINEKNVNKLIGLPMDDIYDTIYNELFLNIYKIKWIIYDVVPSYPILSEPIPM